jgi:hypothetical protein
MQSWSADDLIKQTVKSCWQETMTKMVDEELSNSGPLREKIIAAVEAKIRGQLNAITKRGTK